LRGCSTEVKIDPPMRQILAGALFDFVRSSRTWRAEEASQAKGTPSDAMSTVPVKRWCAESNGVPIIIVVQEFHAKCVGERRFGRAIRAGGQSEGFEFRIEARALR